ncbi:MAG: hypothetical protein ACYCOU_14375 [Sulfobacillus sp.]
MGGYPWQALCGRLVIIVVHIGVDYTLGLFGRGGHSDPIPDGFADRAVPALNFALFMESFT